MAQHGRAAAADDDGLCVREDGCDGEAAGALDVHEEGAWDGYEGLLFVRVSEWFCSIDGPGTRPRLCCNGTGGGAEEDELRMYLELVLSRFSGWCWVEQVDGENLSWCVSSVAKRRSEGQWAVNVPLWRLFLCALF